MYFRILTVLLFAGSCSTLSGQKKDSLTGYELHEVVVSGLSDVKEVRSTTPLQTLDSEEIQHLNALQLSDAVKYFSGVTVKDYGGIGGLKTVSVRSLGANHTAVGYDGITLSDCQSGQIDLSRFSLDQVESISLNAGQNDDIFQTARMFASASVLNVKTADPQFSSGKNYRIRGNIKTGSYGLLNPQLLLENKLGQRFASSLNLEWLRSEGDYPYTLYYGEKTDSTSREKRTNSDVNNLRLEGGWYGQLKNQARLKLKAYYYQSERGLPGSTTFYYTVAHQRLEDRQFFTQGKYEQELSTTLSWQVNGKFNWSYQQYTDPDDLGSETRKDHFYQWEYYLSSGLYYRLIPQLSFSFVSDATLHTMNADLPSFAYPQRFTWLSVLAGKFVTKRFSLIADLLATVVNESTQYRAGGYHDKNYGKRGENSQKFTPSVSLSFQPFSSEDLRLRLMYKEIFRMPTFNDLYYSRVGNPDLRPEFTWQYNAGITWLKKIAPWFPSFSITLDGYYNQVHDKIVAVPGENLFKWSIQNLGKVDIYGTDITISARFGLAERYQLNLSGAYTFQKAWDVTSKTNVPEKFRYKHQIPYTPEQSGSGCISLLNPWVNVAYTLLYSGERYTLSQDRVAGYTDQSLSFSKRLHGKKVAGLLRLEILNWADKQYEVIKGFPMQGRSYRVGLNIEIP